MEDKKIRIEGAVLVDESEEIEEESLFWTHEK
jgi:hypothetical protein